MYVLVTHKVTIFDVVWNFKVLWYIYNSKYNSTRYSSSNRGRLFLFFTTYLNTHARNFANTTVCVFENFPVLCFNSLPIKKNFFYENCYWFVFTASELKTKFTSLVISREIFNCAKSQHSGYFHTLEAAQSVLIAYIMYQRRRSMPFLQAWESNFNFTALCSMPSRKINIWLIWPGLTQIYQLCSSSYTLVPCRSFDRSEVRVSIVAPRFTCF